MRIKHPKDQKNIFWTRDNGDIQYDNHAKHGSKIYPTTHECNDICNTYKHSLLNLLPDPPKNKKRQFQGPARKRKDIKEGYALSHVYKFLTWPIIIKMSIHKETCTHKKIQKIRT